MVLTPLGSMVSQLAGAQRWPGPGSGRVQRHEYRHAVRRSIITGNYWKKQEVGSIVVRIVRPLWRQVSKVIGSGKGQDSALTRWPARRGYDGHRGAGAGAGADAERVRLLPAAVLPGVGGPALGGEQRHGGRRPAAPAGRRRGRCRPAAARRRGKG